MSRVVAVDSTLSCSIASLLLLYANIEQCGSCTTDFFDKEVPFDLNFTKEHRFQITIYFSSVM